MNVKAALAWVVVGVAALSIGGGVAGAPPEGLVKNGDFKNGLESWRGGRGISVETVDGAKTLTIASPGAGSDQRVALDSNWYKLKLTMRMRATGVEVGDQDWKDARLAMTFLGADGKRVGDWPRVFNASGSTEWLPCERTYVIPAGAAFLSLSPANFGKSGKAEFQDIRLEMLELRPVKGDVPPPAPLSSLWGADKAWRESSATRESICVNGLWRLLPVMEGEASSEVPKPGECWGWFKVPGVWPRASDWNVGEPAQELLIAPWLLSKYGDKLEKVDQAWYQRTINIPASWAGRRIFLDFGMVQTHAKVFIDGKSAGELWFPGGQVDVGPLVRPGGEHVLSVLLTARPLDAESAVFMAPDRVFKDKVTIKIKGLTGDVFLQSEPASASISDLRISCSTRKGSITFDTAIANAPAGERLSMTAVVSKDGKAVRTFKSGPLQLDPEKGRVSFSADWKDAELWDADTPQNIYCATVSLSGSAGKLLDESLPVKFGFREFWIDGRDFYLNGSKLHLRCLFVENICDNADRAAESECATMFDRMAAYGFNFFITSNYNFAPGAVGYMEGLFNAADAKGMLCSFSLPHIKDFKSKLDDPVYAGRYRRLCEYLIRKAQNHPSIIMYAMNHNSTGYHGDQNPLKIDGIYNPDEAEGVTKGFAENRAQALLAAGMANSIDPDRPVYHHESGNLGPLHTANTYLNWAPRQERSDWLEHWAEKGVKPLFFVEWGMPHIASWSSYRGPEFIWRCNAFQQIWDSEFAAPCIGEPAYAMTPAKVKALRDENKFWEAGKPFHYPSYLVRNCQSTYVDVQAWYVNDNWKAHRAWGISATLPWDQADLWNRVKASGTKAVADRYSDLQRPGIRPDFITPGRQYIYEPEQGAFEPNNTGLAFRRWNMPHLGFIGGSPAFTDKAHNFRPGERVSKQLVIVNDSRRSKTCKYEWSLKGCGVSGSGQVEVKPGCKELVPVSFEMPSGDAASCELSASFDFGDGSAQRDSFALDRIPSRKGEGGGVLGLIGLGRKADSLELRRKALLFDPKGLTSRLLDAADVPYVKTSSLDDLPEGCLLMVGREAFAADPSVRLKLSPGCNTLIFEQDYQTLTSRFGFRATELGVRETFVRTPSHPALAGLCASMLSGWRGAATLLNPHLDVPPFEKGDPKWSWCGFESTRVWRCGNRNSVASVIIEKPERGDWLPLLDCGFDLQYSPLLEYSGDGSRTLLCQMDVSGRSEEDPAAVELCRRLVAYLDSAPAPATRRAFYDGDRRGEELLSALGVQFSKLGADGIPADSLIVLGPKPSVSKDVLSQALERGCNVVCLGLGKGDLDALLPGALDADEKEAVPEPCQELQSVPEFRGVSNAELHWRSFPKLASLASSEGGSNPHLRVLRRGKGSVVLCQSAPWLFDYQAKPWVRTSYRRSVFLASRLLANAGAAFKTPLQKMLQSPPRRESFPLGAGWRAADETALQDAVAKCPRPDFDDSSWKAVDVPGHSYSSLGYYWYRLSFETPKGLPENEEIVLSVGAIDDESWIWLNGKFLGEVTKANTPDGYWRAPRDYKMSKGDLKADGPNVLAVRVNNIYRDGGMVGHPCLSVDGAWIKSYYLQKPIADDNPYRYYRW